MKMKLWTGVLLVLLLGAVTILTLTGCEKKITGKGMAIPEPQQELLDNFDVALANASNNFGLELFKKLMDEKENVFISPTSIYTALAMTLNGARDETLEAMAAVLGIGGVELQRFNENNLARLYQLQEADPDVIFNIANSLWMREGMEFDPDFVELSGNYYNASARELDFNTREAVDIINEWVELRTNGLIDEIVEYPIDPYAVLFLINAVYFLGEWSEPFNPELTINRTFQGPAGDIGDVPFMQRDADFSYLEQEGEFQAVRLPYGDTERLAMYVFLPDEQLSLAEFVAGLDGEKWDGWRSQFKTMQGSLSLPRFSMEYEKSLNDVLEAMGMEIAFDENRADFFDMVERKDGPRLYISEVKHKSFIEVDEVGTEAAAVTSVEIRVESAPLDYFWMDVNRPFFFLIHDGELNEILFCGTVMNPTD